MALASGWIETVKDGLTNPAWDEYDALIKNEVGECVCSQTASGYNPRLVEDPLSQYKCVDWLWPKAMIWTETGANRPEWKSRPMQIGNSGDPAYAVLKAGSEGADLIMTAALHDEIKTQSINSPQLNIRAGIAYLFTRMAKFDVRSVLDPANPSIQVTTVLRGDSLSTIADRVGTTVEVLAGFQSQSLTSPIRPGQKLQYRRAAKKRVISGWRTWDSATVAARYNGGGDPVYAEKLEFVFDLFRQLKR